MSSVRVLPKAVRDQPGGFANTVLPWDRIWPGAAAAAVGIIAILLAGGGIELAVAVGVLWLASLFLVQPSEVQDRPFHDPDAIDQGTMDSLIEPLTTPLMLIENMRVTRANQAARETLGGHIVGQDARVALRHPEAIALLQDSESGSVQIQGLVRPRSVWEVIKRPYNGRYTVVELVNRSSEADLSRAHTDFVANASHELRTPLASIIGYVETLADPEDEPPKKQRGKFLDTVLSEANRMQALVEDLMSLSRVEANKHERPATPVDLNALVERAARDGAGPKRVERLVFQFARPFTVLGDSQQLEQVVRNLVDNALKYGGPGEPVTVALAPTAREGVLLTIEDRGPGIAPEHIPHLTRRFYRTDPGRSRAGGGTGLGLAIVKHIVERHLGRLEIDSVLGRGTKVAIRMPELVIDEVE